MTSKLQEVIKTLIDISIAINLKTELVKILDENKNLINQFKIKPEYKLVETKILFDIQIKEYCIINICSFLDEYEKYFAITYIENSFEKEILEIKQILKPFIKEIKRDYNLKDYRNHILAHNLRDNSKSLLMGEINRIYNFPKYTDEFQSINQIINLMMRIILNQFKNDLPENYWQDKVIDSQKIVMNRVPKNFEVDKLNDITESFLRK